MRWKLHQRSKWQAGCVQGMAVQKIGSVQNVGFHLNSPPLHIFDLWEPFFIISSIILLCQCAYPIFAQKFELGIYFRKKYKFFRSISYYRFSSIWQFLDKIHENNLLKPYIFWKFITKWKIILSFILKNWIIFVIIHQNNFLIVIKPAILLIFSNY